MESEDAKYVVRKVRPWLIGIASLLALFTILSMIILAVALTAPDQSTKVIQPVGESLPVGLRSAEQRDKLFSSFQDVYNSRDYHSLFQMMSPAFQVQNPVSELPGTMNRLHALASNIDAGAYDHFEYMGVVNGAKSWKLYFPIRHSGGKTGTLTMSIAQRGGEPFVINGFSIVD